MEFFNTGMKKLFEIICCFIILPVYSFSGFGDMFLEISAAEKALSYKEHRELEKKFQQERKQAFSNYKKEHSAYKTERRRLKIKRQNQNRENFDWMRAETEKKWNREQSAYQKARQKTTEKYIEQRDLHRKKNRAKKELLEQIKPDREFVL